LTTLVSCVSLALVQPDGTDAHVAPVPALNVIVRLVDCTENVLSVHL